MIAAWILYVTVVGALFALGAAAAERVASAIGRPIRWVWLASIGATVLWPLVALMTLSPNAAQTSADGALPPIITTVQNAAATVLTFVGPRGVIVDVVLAGAWVVVSLAMVFRLTRARMRLEGESRAWAERDVDGVSVLVSDNTGPAVIGIRPMKVVLPAWSLDLATELRALILRHEEEHRRARDPYVLLAASMLAVLAPWNIALWWQIRRLRLAVEMDCDARVLRVHPRAERYGMLLVAIAQRRSLPHGVLAPALAEPTSTLERRIIAMRSIPGRFRVATALGFAALASAAIVVACTADAPSTTEGDEPTIVAPVHTTAVTPPNSEAMPSVLVGSSVPRYPDMLRSANVEGEVLATFVVDEDGKADMSTFKVLKSTHDLFTNSVRDALGTMRFTPAKVNGKAVRKVVQMPFVFSLSR